MIEVALMMLFGKLQEFAGRSWQWALAFALIGGLLSGFAPMVFLVRLVVSFAYFRLLQRFQDNIALWLGIYVLFPFSLWILAIMVVR